MSHQHRSIQIGIASYLVERATATRLGEADAKHSELSPLRNFSIASEEQQTASRAHSVVLSASQPPPLSHDPGSLDRKRQDAFDVH